VRVLIVEDNPADAALVRTLLEDSGIREVQVASRLSDAVAILSESSFDVGLLDMSLPDAQGLEALQRLHMANTQLPIVILSGQQDEALATTAVQSGAQDYLIKGYVSELTLGRALRYAIERQQLLARLSASVAELESQRGSVIQLNQLKNDLISVLAHDFKGPLTSILGYAELIAEGALGDDDTREAATVIRKNVARLNTLANDTLALSRIEHGELELAVDNVNLGELVREIVERMKDARDIVVSVETEDSIVSGDLERLRQVFENLIRNAVKYSPDGDVVSVTVRSQGEYVRVAITDRGIGIPPAELPNLFKRFARASNAKNAKIQGTGIGLFLVKMLVEKHSGRVEVESEVNRGSTFAVILPRRATQRRLPQIAILASDATLGPFVTYVLRSNGYRVREYRTVTELHERFKEEPCDAIIVDRDRIAASASMIRAGIQGSPILIGIGTGLSDGWHLTLPSAFLAAELLTALEEPQPYAI